MRCAKWEWWTVWTALFLIHPGSTQTAIHVDLYAPTGGDGSVGAPLVQLDDAIQLAIQTLASSTTDPWTTISIILAEGDYHLDGDPHVGDGLYTFDGGYHQNGAVEIVGAACDSFSSTIHFGPLSVGKTSVDITLRNSASLTFRNVGLGCPANQKSTWRANTFGNSSFLWQNLTLMSLDASSKNEYCLFTQSPYGGRISMSNVTFLPGTNLYSELNENGLGEFSGMNIPSDSHHSSIRIAAYTSNVIVKDSSLLMNWCYGRAQSIFSALQGGSIRVSDVEIQTAVRDDAPDGESCDLTYPLFSAVNKGTIHASRIQVRKFESSLGFASTMSTVVDDIDASESGSRHENSFARAESGAFFNITNAVLKDARGCISYSAATGFCQNITSTTPAVSDYVMRAGALCHLTVKDLSVIGASGGTDGAVLYITQSNVDLDNLTVLRMDCYWACFRINHAYSVHFSNSVLKGNKVTEGFFRIENSAVAVDFAKPFIFSNLYFESNTGPLLLAFRIALEIHNSTFKNHPPVTGSGLDHPVLFVFADRISRMLAVNNLFTDNRGPGDGSIVRQCGGNLTFVRNTFSDNKAVGNGGAIYCDLWYGNALVVTNNTFLRNNAVNGAGVYVANMQSPTHFRITNNIFQANVAKLRGGGWYSTQQDILPVQNGNVYVDNTAKGATGGGTGISGIVVSNGGDLITTTSGVSLPDIQVKGVDLLGNKFFSDPLDPAILLYLSTGQNSTAAISGKALRMLLGDEVTFSGVAVSGGVGDHQLQIEQRTVGSQYGLAEVAIPVKIIQCLPPRYMLPTGASSEMKCRLPLCASRGCVGTGSCVADDLCSCQASYEGWDCSLPKFVNDSLITSLPAASFPVTSQQGYVQVRNQIFEAFNQAYQGLSTVVFRDFYDSRDKRFRLFKYSLVSPLTGEFVLGEELKGLTGRAMTALSSLNINTNTTMTAVSAGNLANPSVDESTFKIVAAFCAILCVVTLAGGIFALLRIASDQTLLVANGLLYLGIATLFALPMTEVVRPSSASCMVQVVMAVPTLGFITSALLVKAHYYYTRHKNPLSLQQKLSQRETYWYNAIAGFIVLVYAVLVLSWLLIDRPAPVLVYIASSSERYYICGSSQTQPKFLFGLIGLTGPLILGALYLAKKVTDSPSIPARETQFIMLNAVNMRVLGAAMVGLMLGNFMAGSIQPAIRVTLEVMVAGVLGGSFLGFKIFDSMMKNHRANSEGGKMGTTSSWRMSFQTHSKRISTLDAARDAGSMVPVRPARLGQPLFHAPWRIYQIILTKVYMHLMPVARSRGITFLTADMTCELRNEEQSDSASVLVTCQESEIGYFLQFEKAQAAIEWIAMFNKLKE